jgi:flagellar biosynthetic protein FliQ
MEPQDAIELGRQAIAVTLMLAAPVLIAGMMTGLLVGLLQALTQIQEQTVAFVPKIIAMVLAIGFALPWLISELVGYSRDLFTNIPNML